MNPYVSPNWIEIAFPAAMTALICGGLWRQRPRSAKRLYTVGSLTFILALAGAVASNLFYQRALSVTAWPVVGIFDQVIVTPTHGVFVKLVDPIMGRSNRVQRYDCRGNFQAAFQPDNGGGLFKIAVNEDRTLSIYSVRTDTIDTFDFDGTLLQRREVDASEMPFDFQEGGPSVTNAGDCEFTTDPDSGRAGVKSGGTFSTLERGSWTLEYLLTRQNFVANALLGALMLLASYIRRQTT